MASLHPTLLLTRVHRPAPSPVVDDLPLSAEDIVQRLIRLSSEDAVSDYTRQWASAWIGGFRTSEAAPS